MRSQQHFTFDVEKIRVDFPALQQEVHNKQLVYLDNAATTQKPDAVIRSVNQFYSLDCSNVHRGVHTLSERATKSYEDSRKKIQQFISAKSPKEILFVRGTTEAINLVAQSYGRSRLKAGDEILITEMEHHSNIVPWQILCEQIGTVLKVAPINNQGELIVEEFERLMGPKTKLVSVVHISNALGTINPVKRMIEKAHERKIPVLIDGAQALPHRKVDVQDLDCDFYAFSSHKMFGPTGVGVLYGKEALLESMPPYQGGGDMIKSVTFEKTIYNDLPYRFEAGTPNIAGVIGFGAAVDYLNEIGRETIEAYEQDLLEYGTKALSEIPGIKLIGTAKEKASILSFVVDGVHPHDMGTLLDEDGIAIRTGHHCAQPVMEHFKIPATCRASLAFYNTKEEVDALVEAIYRAKGVFA